MRRFLALMLAAAAVIGFLIAPAVATAGSSSKGKAAQAGSPKCERGSFGGGRC